MKSKTARNLPDFSVLFVVSASEFRSNSQLGRDDDRKNAFFRAVGHPDRVRREVDYPRGKPRFSRIWAGSCDGRLSLTGPARAGRGRAEHLCRESSSDTREFPPAARDPPPAGRLNRRPGAVGRWIAAPGTTGGDHHRHGPTGGETSASDASQCLAGTGARAMTPRAFMAPLSSARCSPLGGIWPRDRGGSDVPRWATAAQLGRPKGSAPEALRRAGAIINGRRL